MKKLETIIWSVSDTKSLPKFIELFFHDGNKKLINVVPLSYFQRQEFLKIESAIIYWEWV